LTDLSPRDGIKQFLHFATQQTGGAITFGVVFEPKVNKWVGAMQAGGQRCLFPPGAGRIVARELLTKADKSTRDLGDQMRSDLGANEFAAILANLELCAKTAMERNAANINAAFAPSDSDHQ
jgi:hypothetical protein